MDKQKEIEELQNEIQQIENRINEIDSKIRPFCDERNYLEDRVKELRHELGVKLHSDLIGKILIKRSFFGFRVKRYEICEVVNDCSIKAYVIKDDGLLGGVERFNLDEIGISIIDKDECEDLLNIIAKFKGKNSYSRVIEHLKQLEN